MRRFEPLLLLPLAAGMLLAQPRAEKHPDARLENATIAVRDMMHAADKGIPRDLLEKAQCVVVIPDLLKGAFLVGGQYGRGYATCRHDGGWTGPAAVRMEGGSFGFQLGGSSTDLIMLVMNHNGMNRLLGDKFTIGGEAAAAAGPLGRQTSAQTDIAMHAEILSWSRSRGVFAGISLNGATLRPDKSEDRRLYGREISNREILETGVPVPPAGRAFVAEISRSAREPNAPVEARNREHEPNATPAPREDRHERAMMTDSPIQFASGEVTVPHNAEPVLAKVAQTLKDNPSWRIHIIGYTDNSGSQAENMKVSRERAHAVMNWLAAHGVDKSRMTAAGHGEAHPVADNSTDSGRDQNRRVEIIRSDVHPMPTGL